MRHRQVWLLAFGLAGAVPAYAQQPDSAEQRSIEERIDDLDQQIRILKRLQELKADTAAQRAREQPTMTASGRGFSWRSADSSFQLRIRGYIQADSRLFHDDADRPLTSTFELRRIRPIVEATIYRYFDLRIMPDFGQGRTQLFDGWVSARVARALRFTAGKFKGPVALERLQSATDLLFIERAYPTGLAPNRDVGFEVAGEIGTAESKPVETPVLSYELGIFDGTPDGASVDGDLNDSKDVHARLFLTPFAQSGIGFLRGLSIGVAGTLGEEHGTFATPATASYRTIGQNTFFSYRSGADAATTVVADGRRRRIAPQAYYHWGRVGLLGEWTRSWQDVTLGASSARVGVTGWQAAGSFELTGEDASFRGVVPKRPVDPVVRGAGAVELVGRYTTLIVDDAAFPTFANPASSARRAREWAAGVNWYVERGVKLSVNYAQTSFRGGAAAGADRPKEKAILTQMQLAF